MHRRLRLFKRFYDLFRDMRRATRSLYNFSAGAESSDAGAQSSSSKHATERALLKSQPNEITVHDHLIGS